MDGRDVLAERIRVSGLTNAEIARRVEVRRQAVSNWIGGHANPTKDNLEKLDELLGAQGDILRAYGYDAPTGECTPEGAIQRDDRFDDSDKRLLLSMIRDFAERRAELRRLAGRRS